MCIIVIKPAGVAMPGKSTLKECWESNPHGAGLMFAANGKVHIEKGFMHYDGLRKRLEGLAKVLDLKATAMVIHFRIGTHGGNTPQNTHPFPVSPALTELRKTTVNCRVGMAHNGIIHNTPRRPDISDTMEYILAVLAPMRERFPKFYNDDDALKTVGKEYGSKFVFLASDGTFKTVGGFNEREGVLYSNYSYMPRWVPATPAKLFEIACPELTKRSRSMTAALVWLNNHAERIVMPDGYKANADDYLIDEHGAVYEYEWELDAACRVPGATITPVGPKSTRWSIVEAEPFPVMPSDIECGM